MIIINTFRNGCVINGLVCPNWPHSAQLLVKIARDDKGKRELEGLNELVSEVMALNHHQIVKGLVTDREFQIGPNGLVLQELRAEVVPVGSSGVESNGFPHSFFSFHFQLLSHLSFFDVDVVCYYLCVVIFESVERLLASLQT